MPTPFELALLKRRRDDPSFVGPIQQTALGPRPLTSAEEEEVLRYKHDQDMVQWKKRIGRDGWTQDPDVRTTDIDLPKDPKSRK